MRRRASCYSASQVRSAGPNAHAAESNRRWTDLQLVAQPLALGRLRLGLHPGEQVSAVGELLDHVFEPWHLAGLRVHAP